MPKEKKLLNRILDLLNPKKSSPAARPVDPMVLALMTTLKTTYEDELTCDEVYELIDQYVELAARGEDVEHLYPLVKRHLDRCRDCLEEYEGLLRVLSAA